MEIIVLLLGLGVPMSIGTVLFIITYLWQLNQRARDNAVRREIALTHFKYDALGNPTGYFNSRSGVNFAQPVGNKAFPDPQQNVLVIGGQPLPLPARYERHERPIVLNTPTGGPKLALSDRNGQQTTTTTTLTTTTGGPKNVSRETDETDGFEPETPVSNDETFQNLGEKLRNAKKEGRSQREAIPAITGVKPGGSAAWKDYSEIWNRL